VIRQVDVARGAGLARAVALLFGEAELAAAIGLVETYASIVSDLVNVLEAGTIDRGSLEQQLKDAMTMASDAEMVRELHKDE